MRHTVQVRMSYAALGPYTDLPHAPKEDCVCTPNVLLRRWPEVEKVSSLQSWKTGTDNGICDYRAASCIDRLRGQFNADKRLNNPFHLCRHQILQNNKGGELRVSSAGRVWIQHIWDHVIDTTTLNCWYVKYVQQYGVWAGSEPNAHATCQWRGSKGFNATLPTYMLTKGLRGTFSVIIISQREGLSVRAYGLSLYNVKKFIFVVKL